MPGAAPGLAVRASFPIPSMSRTRVVVFFMLSQHPKKGPFWYSQWQTSDDVSGGAWLIVSSM